jgi:hypothetical protein
MTVTLETIFSVSMADSGSFGKLFCMVGLRKVKRFLKKGVVEYLSVRVAIFRLDNKRNLRIMFIK